MLRLRIITAFVPVCLSSCLSVCLPVYPSAPENSQELRRVLKYHMGEGMLVSGGVTSHTRLQPLLGERLEMGMVCTPHPPPTSSTVVDMF